MFVPIEDGERSSSLHEDDGLTKAHRAGAFVRTTFVVTRQGNELRVRASVTGKGYAEHRRRSFTLVFHGSIHDVVIDGQQARFTDGRVKLTNRGSGFEVVARAS